MLGMLQQQQQTMAQQQQLALAQHQQHHQQLGALQQQQQQQVQQHMQALQRTQQLSQMTGQQLTGLGNIRMVDSACRLTAVDLLLSQRQCLSQGLLCVQHGAWELQAIDSLLGHL